MRDDCIRAVTEAAAKAGRTLTATDLAGIEGSIRKEREQMVRENRDAYLKMTPAEQVAQAGERVAKQIEADRQRNAANVARQVIKYDENMGFVERMAKQGMRRLEAVNHLLQNYLTGKGGFKTMEAAREGVVRLAKASMEPIARATQQYAGFWTDRAMLRNIVRELHGEDSGNAKAKEVAKLWTDTADMLRRQFNELGGDIRQRKGWAAPQEHSMFKVNDGTANATNNWIDYIMPRLDRSAYTKVDGSLMGDSELRALLAESWLSITTDGAWNLTQSGRGGSIKNRGQDARVLHFANADAYMDYQAKYGDRSLLEIMNGHIERMGSNIAALQTFGPNAEAGLRALLDDAMRNDVRAGLERSTADKLRAKAEIAFALASGKMGQMGDPKVAHRFQVAR
ncbi:MAG TPA: hypothetical protein VHQ21_05050, partial [Rhodanobacteraceae bacterium]|nr:hypothetical protein [Rhodanobacteraceae bacterium]